MLSELVGLEALAVALTLLPGSVSALSLVQTLGFLDIFIGLFLTLSMVLFVAGLVIYFTRYGTVHRADAFKYTQWAIALLFVIIVVLGLVHGFQLHPVVLRYVVGVILFLIIIGILMHLLSSSGGEKGKEERH